jgi:hypothetical protein
MPRGGQFSRAADTWAQENGFSVSERGRIPSEVLQANADRDTTPAPAEAARESAPTAEDKPKHRGRRKATAA